ncbi:MAG: hypothetical protein JWM11_1539 [Planctomycetaceae bacterium]|nr:hypothetical protein [Planctomycetaceae bacterium]
MTTLRAVNADAWELMQIGQLNGAGLRARVSLRRITARARVSPAPSCNGDHALDALGCVLG